MSVLNILHFPDPRLRLKAQPVEVVDDSVRALVDDMFESMRDADGIGLAAIQVNVPLRVVVMDLDDEDEGPRVFINPTLRALPDATPEFSEEGCLSVPDYRALVSRASAIEISALDTQGEPFTLRAEGMLAICAQHEVDHLNGKLFIDYLSPLRRAQLRKQLIRDRRAAMA